MFTISLSKTQRIGLNAITSACQVLVVGLVYFFLYRFLLKQLGPSMLGIWSLVLATASIATMANLGITAGLVKFVADFDAIGSRYDLHTLITTAFISIVIFFGVLVILLYFVFLWILPWVITPEYLGVASKMLPFSLLSLFINEVGGVFTSVLDGLQKNYRKNIIYIISSTLLLIGSYAFVPKFGIVGMAYAQVGQSLFVAIAAFLFCSKLINVKHMLKSRWNKPIFKQIFSYGIKFQFISVCQMLYEPTTKALISTYGGLPLLGFYEMASRLVSQVRAIVVNGNQVMVPVIAASMHTDTSGLKKIYENSVSIIILITVPLISSLFVFAPFISFVWTGYLEPRFITSVYWLCGGVFFNIVCGPAYFGFLGEGKLSELLKIHALMAVANILLGALAGKWLGGFAIIAAWSIVLAGGSIFVMKYYQKSKQIKFAKLISENSRYVLLCGILPVILVKFFLKYMPPISIAWQFIIEVSILCVVMIPSIITRKHFNLIVAGRFKKNI